MKLLGPDGEPTAVAAVPEAAPIPLEPRLIKIEDGPLKIRTVVEFKDIAIGGIDRAAFCQAIDAVLFGAAGLAVRVVELMILGAQKQDESVGGIAAGALGDVRLIRQAVEGVMVRVQKGMPAIPLVIPAGPA